jgi:hypothetical protein
MEGEISNKMVKHDNEYFFPSLRIINSTKQIPTKKQIRNKKQIKKKKNNNNNNNNNNNKIYLLDIPNEILEIIISFVQIEDLWILMMFNKTLKNIIVNYYNFEKNKKKLIPCRCNPKSKLCCLCAERIQFSYRPNRLIYIREIPRNLLCRHFTNISGLFYPLNTFNETFNEKYVNNSIHDGIDTYRLIKFISFFHYVLKNIHISVKYKNKRILDCKIVEKNKRQQIDKFLKIDMYKNDSILIDQVFNNTVKDNSVLEIIRNIDKYILTNGYEISSNNNNEITSNEVQHILNHLEQYMRFFSNKIDHEHICTDKINLNIIITTFFSKCLEFEKMKLMIKDEDLINILFITDEEEKREKFEKYKDLFFGNEEEEEQDKELFEKKENNKYIIKNGKIIHYGDVGNILIKIYKFQNNIFKLGKNFIITDADIGKKITNLKQSGKILFTRKIARRIIFWERVFDFKEKNTDLQTQLKTYLGKRKIKYDFTTQLPDKKLAKIIKILKN